jgi:hypothetical protein
MPKEIMHVHGFLRAWLPDTSVATSRAACTRPTCDDMPARVNAQKQLTVRHCSWGIVLVDCPLPAMHETDRAIVTGMDQDLQPRSHVVSL